MRFRRLLIVNESNLSRNFLKRLILSELDDVHVIEAASGAEALEKLAQKKFELVLCAKELVDINGLNLTKEIEARLPKDKQAPVLIITSVRSGSNIQELLDAGIQHYLVAPFTPLELRAKIDAVCNPRSWRVHPRYSIPNTKATIHLPDETMEARAVNLSTKGFLLHVSTQGDLWPLFKYDLLYSFSFPETLESATIEGIRGKINRCAVLEWGQEGKPNAVQLAVEITRIDNETRDALKAVFQRFEEHAQKW